jgi:hypothetical protein
MVYVVTGNGYPTAVFKTRQAAEAFAKTKRENKAKPKDAPQVTWHVEEFRLR